MGLALNKVGSKLWILLIVAFIGFDAVVVAGFVYVFMLNEAERMMAAELARMNATPTPTATPSPTATLWAGPPPTLTPTSTLLPTPAATEVLAASGFPVGFTPTPRPTREPVTIRLPIIAPLYAGSVDVPVINQIYYPEPFFLPGSNNACGPVALFAGFYALGMNVNYTHLRDVAVQQGFTHYGISKWGMINTANTLNQELGNVLAIEHGNRYAAKDLMRQIRQGGVAIVLIRVRRAGGRYYPTDDFNNSIGHFLIVESINMRNKTVQFAGSTLGMDKVSLEDFLKSWAENPQAVINSSGNLQNYIRQEPASNWALIIKKRI
jgi:hypothetical protein